MGAQAKARKRRRNLKVKMPHSQRNRSKFIKPVFSSQVVKEHWDNTLSARQNLAKLGLALEGNQAVGDARGRSKVEAEGEATEFFDVPESDNLAAIDHNPRRRIMSEEDQHYMAKVMSLHGHHYKAMERDIETNWMQHTQARLRKLGSRFLLLDETQRLVPVPEGVMNST